MISKNRRFFFSLEIFLDWHGNSETNIFQKLESVSMFWMHFIFSFTQTHKQNWITIDDVSEIVLVVVVVFVVGAGRDVFLIIVDCYSILLLLFHCCCCFSNGSFFRFLRCYFSFFFRFQMDPYLFNYLHAIDRFIVLQFCFLSQAKSIFPLFFSSRCSFHISDNKMISMVASFSFRKILSILIFN